MNARKTRILLTVAFATAMVTVGVVLWYTSATAQPPMPPDMGGGAPFGREEMIKRFDTDGDGQLSEEEQEAMREAMDAALPFGREDMTKRFDTDGDGELSKEEREAMREGMRGFMGGPGGRGRPPFGMHFQTEKLVKQFDIDGDGKLDHEERRAARKHIQEERETKGASRPDQEKTEEVPGAVSEVTEAAQYPNAGLYDEKVLRALFLEFPNKDWYEELGDFYRTDVDIPADLTVDGVAYPSVGVRFRGNSSYSMTGKSAKKPFNIAIDYNDPNQRLYGYKTLNLLSGHADASFIREVLYSRICRDYIPAPKANFVKLVINGENWGIYTNLQQFNKDFLRDWFGTRRGVRWKISPGRNRGGSLAWNGPDVADYKDAFQLKTGRAPDDCWDDLVKLCETLDKTPDEELEAALNPVLNIDRALWLIALENTFIDSDGYISRGSDYYLYKDPDGRFSMIPYDNNETFRFAGGGGPNMWPSNDPMLSPVAHEDNENLPVISRLLSIPHLRARYLAHVRTIVSEWLDWDVLNPIITEYQSLIDAEVKADSKKLYAYDAFANSQTKDVSGGEGPGPGGFGPGGDFGRRGGFGRRGAPDGEGGRRRGTGRGGGPGGGVTPSFKRFVSERREFLLNHPEINKPTPVIQWVSQYSAPVAWGTVQIKAEVSGDVELESALLYYSTGTEMLFDSVKMQEAGNGVYSGEIPPFLPGTHVHYYVEARSAASVGTTTFAPPGVELGAFTYRVAALIAESSPVVINEFMARNAASITDPQGEYDDWIELYNTSDAEVDLSGMYLSDNKDDLRKWAFPRSTTIPSGGYLIIWADEDGKSRPGLHANFKLSGNGEIVMLIDRDEKANAILDSIEFGKQEKDAAMGRFTDGSGEFKKMTMTPGRKNKL